MVQLESLDVVNHDYAYMYNPKQYEDGTTPMLYTSNDSTITDNGLEYISELRQLRRLHLGGSLGITDAGLVHVAKLEQLASLALVYCDNVTDAGILHLKSNLQQLTSLDLDSCNDITETGRAVVAHLLTDLCTPLE